MLQAMGTTLKSPAMPVSSTQRRSNKFTVHASSTSIESVGVNRPEINAAVSKALKTCLVETNLGMGKQYVGKVRDTYDLGDKLVIITTDRQSAFDRLLAAVPFKGQVLNQTSAWWMDNTQHIVENALLSIPDPNACIMKKCTVFPVEFVCRGFMTGRVFLPLVILLVMLVVLYIFLTKYILKYIQVALIHLYGLIIKLENVNIAATPFLME